MKKIKTFDLSGTFAPEMKIKARYQFERLIEEQLRAAGSVPVLDMNTVWIIQWDSEKDLYDFSITMYGVYVGKKKARDEVCGYSQEEGKLVLF